MKKIYPQSSESNNAWPARSKRRTIEPPAEVFNRYDGVEITFDLPGVNPDDVKVEISDQQLTFEAPGELGKTARPVTYRRSFMVEDGVDQQGVAVRLERGKLSLWVPRSCADEK